MSVTVRTDFCERSCAFDDLYPKLRRESIINFFDAMTEDSSNNIDDMALILRVDGADISVRCSHLMKHPATSDVELF